MNISLSAASLSKDQYKPGDCQQCLFLQADNGRPCLSPLPSSCRALDHRDRDDRLLGRERKSEREIQAERLASSSRTGLSAQSAAKVGSMFSAAVQPVSASFPDDQQLRVAVSCQSLYSALQSNGCGASSGPQALPRARGSLLQQALVKETPMERLKRLRAAQLNKTFQNEVLTNTQRRALEERDRVARLQIERAARAYSPPPRSPSPPRLHALLCFTYHIACQGDVSVEGPTGTITRWYLHPSS